MMNKNLIATFSKTLLAALLLTSASFIEISASQPAPKMSTTTTKVTTMTDKTPKKKRRVKRIVRRRKKSKKAAKKKGMGTKEKAKSVTVKKTVSGETMQDMKKM